MNIEEREMKAMLGEYQMSGMPDSLQQTQASGNASFSLEERKQELLHAMKAELAKIPPVHERTVFQRMVTQAEYISPITWIAQILLLIGVIWAAVTIQNVPAINVISALMPLVGIIMGAELVRSFDYNTWELELSCRYNLRSTIAMKILIIGALDLIMGLVAATIVDIWGTAGVTGMMLILVPFNISTAIYLLMIMKLNRRCSNYLLMGAGVLITLASFLANNDIVNDGVIKGFISSEFVSIGLIAASIVILAACIFGLLKNTEKGNKIWNYA